MLKLYHLRQCGRSKSTMRQLLKQSGMNEKEIDEVLSI